MWYWIFKALIAPASWVVFRPRVRGRRNIPATGGVILAANHVSALDTILIPAMIRRRVTFPAKAELFVKTKDWRHNFVAWFLKAIGQVPMDRSGGKASANGLQPVIDALREGRVVGIFPEGTRTPDGRLYRGRTGVARLAMTAKVPVIPVGVINTASRKGPLGLRGFWGVQIIYGKPLDYSHLAESKNSHEALRWVTNDILAGIQQLTGQHYVDAYGSLVKYGSMSKEQADSKILSHPHEGKAPIPEVTRS